MTASHSKQLEPLPVANNNCNHPRLRLGLDSAYCPDCKSNFGSRSQEYQNALRPPSPVIPASEYKVGDRVSILREPPQAIYQIVKLADDGHATVESLIKGPGCDRRRIALWKLRPSCALAHLPADAPDTCGESHLDTPQVSGAVPLPADAPDTCGESHLDTGEVSGASGWCETYQPNGRRTQYFRYLWREKGRLKHAHLPGGNVRSPRAQENLALVETAIASGKSPSEIIELIKSWKAPKEKP